MPGPGNRYTILPVDGGNHSRYDPIIAIPFHLIKPVQSTIWRYQQQKVVCQELQTMLYVQQGAQTKTKDTDCLESGMLQILFSKDTVYKPTGLICFNKILIRSPKKLVIRMEKPLYDQRIKWDCGSSGLHQLQIYRLLMGHNARCNLGLSALI